MKDIVTATADQTTFCPSCGQENPWYTRFCPACGVRIGHAGRHRALAVVEGTAGVGKSTLVDLLVRQYLNEHAHVNTVVRLGQGHTYGPLDPDNPQKQHTPEEVTTLLARIYDSLRFLARPLEPAAPPVACAIETLHLTLACRPGGLPAAQMAAYDAKLAAIGCKLILICVRPATHWARCIWERRNNGFITQYGQKYGQSLHEIHAYYGQEQERMLALFAQSTMEKLLLEGELPPEQLLEQAYQFWLQ